MNINYIQNLNTLTFKAMHEDMARESIANNNPVRPYLMHTTRFMRYPEDEQIMKLCAQKFDGEPINVLSVGCSYGEEVYSYAMGFDVLGVDSIINGVDISKEVIEEAEEGVFKLDIIEYDLFHQPEPGSFMFNIAQKFRERFELTKPPLEYTKKPDSYINCNFTQGSALDINQTYKNNSQDLILCRNMLYHLKKSDQIDFLSKTYKITKPGGYFCIESDSGTTNFDMYLNAGFIQPFPNDYPTIFQKPYNAKPSLG